MKRIALRTTAAVAALALSALGNTASASGYMVSWNRTAPAPEAAAQTERTSSGYLVSWGKDQKTERTSSHYMVAWTSKGQPVD